MSTLAELREEVRQLIGSGTYDRFFLPNGSTEWTDDGIRFACDQIVTLLGLTRTDAMAYPSDKRFVIPADAIKIVFMQVR